MVWFRILLALAAAGVIGCVLAWWLTGRQAWLKRAFVVLLSCLGAALLFFAVLIVERL